MEIVEAPTQIPSAFIGSLTKKEETGILSLPSSGVTDGKNYEENLFTTG
jgi:hypothetical protein